MLDVREATDGRIADHPLRIWELVRSSEHGEHTAATVRAHRGRVHVSAGTSFSPEEAAGELAAAITMAAAAAAEQMGATA